MTDRQKSLIEKLGLNESDFEPNTDETTVADLVEALNTLTDIVLGESEEE